MATDPQPTESVPVPPQGQKAAESAALSNLSDAGAEAGSSTATNTAALGAALSNLSVGESSSAAAAAAATATTTTQKTAAPVKKVKVEQADVAFLVEHLEVSKVRATNMLKAAEGSRAKALEAFILPKSTTMA